MAQGTIPTDSSRSWVIAVGCCWINFFSAIAYKSSGVIYVGVLQTLSVSREQASWPLTLLAVFIFATGPLAGILVLYFSIWKISVCGCLLSSLAVCACFFATDIMHLMLCIGAVQGFGLGLLTLHNVIINQHFKKHRATASGISYAGPTLASLVFPPLVQILFDQFGLRGALLLFGAIMLNSVAGAFLQKPPGCSTKATTSHTKSPSYEIIAPSPEALEKSEDHATYCNGQVQNGTLMVRYKSLNGAQENGHSHEDSAGSRTLKNRFFATNKLQDSLAIFNSPMFYLISLSFAVILFNMTTYLTIVVDFAVGHSIPRLRAVLLISSYSIADLAARLGSGWLSDRGFVSRGNMMAVHFLLGGLAMCGMPLFTSYAGQMALSVVSGWASGCTMILVSVLLAEHVGLERLPVSFGVTSLVAGLSCFAGPPLIGYFRDTTGDYEGLFLLVGGVGISFSVFWFVTAVVQRCSAKVRKTDDEL